jgi:YegS/Rv2252/BmrU family lipid kinase
MRFIFNPCSGRNSRSPWLLARTRAFIAEHRLDATVALTDGPRAATALARRAVEDGCRLVVAIGGDGTMNEVAAALLDTDAALGLIPCGSGNGLARHLGIPLKIPAALANLLTGRPRLIDTGRINEHPFFCAAGLGFEARVASAFAAHPSRGLAGYLALSARAFWRHRTEVYHVRHARSRMTVPAFTLVAANADQYGNHAIIAPGARVDDGLLDLVAVPPLNSLHAVTLLCRLFCGTLDRDATVTHLRGAQFTIERPAPGLIHTDGEIHEAAAVLEIQARPRSLHVMVPAAADAGMHLRASAVRPLPDAFKICQSQNVIRAALPRPPPLR